MVSRTFQDFPGSCSRTGQLAHDLPQIIPRSHVHFQTIQTWCVGMRGFQCVFQDFPGGFQDFPGSSRTGQLAHNLAQIITLIHVNFQPNPSWRVGVRAFKVRITFYVRPTFPVICTLHLYVKVMNPNFTLKYDLKPKKSLFRPGQF